MNFWMSTGPPDIWVNTHKKWWARIPPPKKWWCRRIQLPCLPTKINDWTATQEQKLQATLRVHFGSFSTEEKEGNFILPAASHPPSHHYSVPIKNFPAWKIFLSPEKEEVGERSASPASHAGHYTKVQLRFHSTQTSKAETRWDS